MKIKLKTPSKKTPAKKQKANVAAIISAPAAKTEAKRAVVDSDSSESSCDEAETQMMRKAIAKKRKAGTQDKLAAIEAEDLQKRREAKSEKKKARRSTDGETPTKARNGRNYTVSIAVPGSILGNAQSQELQTCLAGQIARAAALFSVDEVVVFDDGLDKSEKKRQVAQNQGTRGNSARNNEFLARILEYLETPQYLRRFLFPMHRDLRFVGLLTPLNTPHHMKLEDWCEYREGVVVDKPSPYGTGCLVNVGLRKEVHIERTIKPNVRLTIRLGDNPGGKPGFWDPYWVKQAKLARQAKYAKKEGGLSAPDGAPAVVSPSEPRETAGLYWGYSTRLATGGLDSVLSEKECPYEGGYDLKVGISESGATSTVDDEGFALPSFKHLLIVFGGVESLEACVDADESLSVPGSEAHQVCALIVVCVCSRCDRACRERV
jgi:predicted SPOUT superfamily RNA methylase MTH1